MLLLREKLANSILIAAKSNLCDKDSTQTFRLSRSKIDKYLN